MVALILNDSSLWVPLCESRSNELHWLILSFEMAAVGPASIFLLILMQSQYVAFYTAVLSFLSQPFPPLRTQCVFAMT